MRRKLFARLLACACLVSSLYVPNLDVQASSLGDTNLSETDLTTGQVNNNDCIVDVNVGSYFTVTLPKKITLAGSDGLGSYDVTVKGDIGGRRRVSVVPDEKFNLSSDGKADVETLISQPKKVFDWSEVSVVDSNQTLVGTTTTGNVTAGPLSKGVWSGTFNFNIGTYEYAIIEVDATDSNSVDLNAESFTIEGQEKEDLLTSLVDSGVVTGATKEDIDAIIEVKSDDFDSIADTIFYVSSIAQDGDTVIILHFDETKQEWELIATDIVVDGIVGGQFSSHSPVAFIVIEQDNPGDIVVPDTSPAPEASPASYFVLNGGYIIGVTDEAKSATEIVIPAEINGVKVLGIETQLDTFVFSPCTNLKSVYISNGIESVGHSAFRGCTKLESVRIPTSVKTIGPQTFMDCTSLQSISIPNSVTYIGAYTFSGTGFTEVKIPNSVVGIGTGLFNGCSNLTKVTLTNKVTCIPDYTFKDCTGITSLTIPSSITEIQQSAFYGCTNLATVTLNEGLTSIATSAFENCTSLVSINIPNSVKTVGANAFKNTPWLANQSTTNGMIIMGSYLIDGSQCSGDVEIPQGVTVIGENAFKKNSSITSVKIPEGVTSIKNATFQDCTNLSSVEIPNGVTQIEDYAFYNCANLSTVEIPSTVEYISKSAFVHTPWDTEVSQRDGLVIVGNGILYTGQGYAGSTLEIPSTIKSIADSAFIRNTNLVTVKIPNSVTYIGSNAFGNCTNLESVEIPGSITSINTNTFYKCVSLESINIPNTVTYIGKQAFYSCTSLESIVIPESVIKTDKNVFQGCTSLKDVTMTGNIDDMGILMFMECTSLESVVLPESMISIPAGMFYRCSNLKEITIPKSVKYINDEAFNGCTSLSTINYRGSEQQWESISINELNNTPLKNATKVYNYTD